MTLAVNFAKIGSSAVTDILITESERLGLLSNRHFLGRPGRTTTDSLHYLTSTIKNTWRKRQVTTVLFLDVKAAFPSVNLNRLYHNLRLRGVPKTLVDWIKIKLANRQTTLQFDDYASELFDILAGLEQGCPMSGVLYQFYNSPLLELANDKQGTYATGNIDDVAIIATGDTFDEAHRKLRKLVTKDNGAFNWAHEHTSSFSVEKFGVLNCSRRLPKNDLGPTLTLQAQDELHILKPIKFYKFLGILVDHKLLWREQIERALDKGLKWLAVFRRIARAKTGIPMCISRRLYLAVAIPRMLYAADVFLLPQHKPEGAKKSKGSVAAIRRLSKVHRQALIMMTGGMCTTATDIMEAHTDTMPFAAIVNKICYHATVRMATLPSTHPLSPIIQSAAKRYVKRHRTHLHELFHMYDIDPKLVETITPARFSHKWDTRRMDLVIDRNADEAKETEEEWQDKHALRIYTDGSDIDGGVGASAVLIHPQQGRDRRRKKKRLICYLGTSDQRTVYEAELVGLILGIILLRKQVGTTMRKVTIAADNQAALRATHLTASKPGHYLLDIFHDLWAKLLTKQKKVHLTLRWVPGHVGIDGNEDADIDAKRAAKGNRETNRNLPCALRNLPQSSSKLRQLKKEDIAKKAQEVWKKSTRFERLKHVDPALTAKAYAALVVSLPRRHAALLFQLRTGHAPLRKHLACIGKADTPTCSKCRANKETVTHYLMECPAYQRARRTLFYEVGRASRSVAQLLSNPELTRPLFRYIHRTKRFEDHFGNTWMDNETEEEKEKRKNAKKKGKGKPKQTTQGSQPAQREGGRNTARNTRTVGASRSTTQQRRPAGGNTHRRNRTRSTR